MTEFSEPTTTKELSAGESGLEIPCPLEARPELFDKPSVFIAGGIGGVGDVENWQQRMIHQMLADTDIIALNPRRENFPVADPEALEVQVTWEHNALKIAQSISFWLPAAYSCPVTVYELGTWSMRAKPIFVGIDPDYPNRDSLVSQLSVTRPNLRVHSSLEKLASDVKAWVNRSGRLDLPNPRPSFDPKSVYLSGGINNCPDWQAEISSSLSRSSIVVVNPRAGSLDAAKITSAKLRELAAANHRKLLNCESFCVWVHEESSSPASLFELGAIASMLERPLFVGAHPNYFRAKDVVLQTGLVRPEVKVVDSLQDLAGQVNEYYSLR